MRWLVTGSTGMLGTDMVNRLRSDGHVVTPVERHGALDLRDLEAVTAAATEHDVIVNCAAWTDVDGAETHEEQALTVNALLPDLLARAAADAGVRLVHLSTDYVFDGKARTPYREEAPTSPTSAYGRTKAAGEEAVREALPHAHLVVRTAWLYGAHGRCFPRTILRLARENGSVEVVTDQLGQPTWTCDVADLVLRLVEADAPAGTYHATSSGCCSWFDLAEAVIRSAGIDAPVRPVDSSAVQRPAPRPAYSVLGHHALHRVGVEPIGPWQDRWEAAAAEVLAGV